MVQSRLENLKNLEIIKTSQLVPKMEKLLDFRFLEKLKLHKVGKHVVEFFNLLKSFSNLKKLDIKRITKKDEDRNNSKNLEKVKAIQLFFLENIKQFEYIKFPKLRYIHCFQIQKKYPNIRFRWYTELPDSNYKIDGIYEGNFEENSIDASDLNQFGGRGVYQYKSERYEGEWKNGVREGMGVELRDKGKSFYKGEWKNDMRHGMGIEVEVKERVSYEGECKFNMRNGIGKAVLSGGNVYEGNWKNDQFEGKGIYTYRDGSRYEGEFRNNMQEGRGNFYFNDGKKYEGEWKNDEMHGLGTMIDINGATYTGEWKNDAKEGVGKQTYSDGSIYEGKWVYNMREGIGILTKLDGTIYNGEWEDDEFVGSNSLSPENFVFVNL
jgi:hypothetical protein